MNHMRMSPRGAPSLFASLFWIIVNITSSVGIVFVNKILFNQYGFPNLTLTTLHFYATGILLLLCNWLGVFSRKIVSPVEVIPLCLSFCGFVALTNLSLELNQVGTYQLLKTLTTPGVVIISQVAYNRKYSILSQLTAIPIIGGVFMYSYFDIAFRKVGIAFGLAAVVVTSIYQVLVSEKQKSLQMDSMQLLLYQAPISAFMLTAIFPFLEPVDAGHGLFRLWPLSCILLVFLSCFIAFVVNLSIFWVIGNTSPLTYNYVGHAKFSLIVVFGWLTFSESVNWMQLVGIGLTILGIVAYTHFRLNENSVGSSTDSSQIVMSTPPHGKSRTPRKNGTGNGGEPLLTVTSDENS